jgi:integrase
MNPNLLKYKEWLIINGNTVNTVKCYLSCLEKYFSVYSDMNEDNINSFFLSLQDNHKPSTINTFKYSVMSYLEFINKDFRLPKNQKIEETPPDIITPEFFENTLIPKVKVLFTNPLKIMALLYFMFYTGIRRSDVLSIKRENINLDTREVMIQQKKTKCYTVSFLTDKAKDIIKSYFVSEAEIKNAFNIGYDNIGRIFKIISNEFPDIKLHPHTFRHSIATHMIKQGVKEFKIQSILGHKNLNSTMKYVHLDKDDIKKEFDELINKDYKVNKHDEKRI